nr:zinc finger MYM-type protein 1-like [Tanacetum cinerariifolium]
MLLSSARDHKDSNHSSADMASQVSIKASFVSLIRFQHRARWSLMRSRACMGVSEHSHGTILCSICKRDCYVAYINCNCYLHPVCLRHEFKPLDLPCGRNFKLSVRDELFDMEAVSRIFEEDIDIVNEVQRQFKNGSDMALLATLYPLAKEDGYIPHCDIDFEEGCNLKHSVPEILVTHDDNSSKDIAKEMDEASSVIDEAPQSNNHAEVKSTCYRCDDSDSEGLKLLKKAQPERSGHSSPPDSGSTSVSIKYKQMQNEEAMTLQKDDQYIVEAVSMVKSTKEQLKRFRLNGFVPLLDTISSFWGKNNIRVVNMDEVYITPNGRKRRVNITNRHFFEVECFNTVVDIQIQEFNDRFSEASTELLANMACLNPCDSFSQFNTSKLVRLSELYLNDFNSVERMKLESQLNLYYANITKDDSFVDLNGITDLATMMVKKRKHISYLLVYRLLMLALILPVATASVERCFSVMKIIKSDLRNRIGLEFLNFCVICGVEREALANVNDEDVMNRFQAMTDRKGHL